MDNLYCGDGDGGFCLIKDYNDFINELKKQDSLEMIYRETVISYEIKKAFKELLEKGFIEQVSGDEENFSMLPDVERSIKILRTDLVLYAGEEIALAVEEDIKEKFSEHLKERLS